MSESVAQQLAIKQDELIRRQKKLLDMQQSIIDSLSKAFFRFADMNKEVRDLQDNVSRIDEHGRLQ